MQQIQSTPIQEQNNQILYQQQQYQMIVDQLKNQHQNLNNPLQNSAHQNTSILQNQQSQNGQQIIAPQQQQQQFTNYSVKNQNGNLNQQQNQQQNNKQLQKNQNFQDSNQIQDQTIIYNQEQNLYEQNGFVNSQNTINQNGENSQINKTENQSNDKKYTNNNSNNAQRSPENNDQKLKQQIKAQAFIKPIVTKEHVQVHKHLRNQIRKSIQMDHGTEEGCKVLKGKRIEFIVHNKKKEYVFIQFAQTNFDAASEGKMINMLYKRLDLKKTRMEEEQQSKNSDNDNSISDDDRQVIFSEDSLNSNQQEQSIHAESVFPNFINETCFIFKKKSTPNGLALDQVLYSDKIIKYIGYDIQSFQLMAVNEGTPTLLQGRESFYSMMKIVQKQANYYLSQQNGVLQSDRVTMVLKTVKKQLIQAECEIQCSLVEGSFYVKIEVLKTITKDYQLNDQQPQEQISEFTAEKLKKFSPHEQEFLRKYIKQTPENELEHNKDKICGFKFVNIRKEQEYQNQLEQHNLTKPKNKKQLNKPNNKKNQKQEKEKQKENAKNNKNNQRLDEQSLQINSSYNLEDPQKETQNPLIPNQPNLTISYNQPSAEYTNNGMTNNFDISDDSDIELDSAKTKETTKISNFKVKNIVKNYQNKDQNINEEKKEKEKLNSENNNNLVLTNDYELQQLQQIEKIKQQQLQLQQNNQQQQQNQNPTQTVEQDENKKNNTDFQFNSILQQQQQQTENDVNKQQQFLQQKSIQLQNGNRNDENNDKFQQQQNGQNQQINNFMTKNTGIITLPENVDDDDDEEF